MPEPLTIEQQYANPYTVNGQTFFAQTPGPLPGGQFNVPPPNTGAPIPSGQIVGGNPLNLPTPSTTTDPTAFINSLNVQAGGPTDAVAQYNALESATQSPEQKQQEQQQTKLTADYQNLSNQLANKGSDTQALEKQYGVSDKFKQVQNLKDQLTQLQIQYNSQYANNELRGAQQGVPQIFTQGENAALQRQQSTLAGNLAIQLAAQTDNLQLALNLVDRTIEMKYQDIQTRIDNTFKFLQLNADNLSRSEAKQAKVIEYAMQQAQTALNDKKEQDKAIQNIMVEAAQSGADAATLSKIQNAKSVPEAINLAGESFGAEFRQKQQQQAFENQIALKQLGVSQMNAQTSRMNAQTSKAAAAQQAAQGSAQGELQLAHSQDSIASVSSLLNNKALNSAVGPIAAARGGITLPFGIKIPTTTKGFTGERQNFIGAVEQLRSNLNLNALINAKANGATFGALSDQEMQLLASSATKIGSWAVKDKNGQVTGYNIDEKSFKAELDRINSFAKLDYVLKGGDPNAVGTHINPDGTVFTTTYDGKPQQIYP